MTFREVLTFRRIPWTPHRSSQSNVWMNCPFCTDERFRLGVDDAKGRAHCFNCDWKSSNGTFEKIFKAMSLMDVAKAFREQGGNEKKQEKLKLPEGFYPISSIQPDDDLGVRAIAYLEKRGFPRELQERWRFGVTFIGKFKYRVVMPIYHKGTLAMYVCRDITGTSNKKYLNSTGPKYLWGLRAASKCEKPLVLAEGIFKALALRDYGLQAAAMMGMTITDKSVEMLKDAGHTSLSVWPDPGRFGVEGGLRLCDRLCKEGFRVSLPMPLPKWQADEKIEPFVMADFDVKTRNRTKSQLNKLQ